MRKIIGGLLLAIPFSAIIAAQVSIYGWFDTLYVWVAGIVASAMIIGGVILLIKD